MNDMNSNTVIDLIGPYLLYDDLYELRKKILRMSWHNSKVIEQPKLMISMLEYRDWVLFKYDDRYEIWT